jgi:carboxymethylenebutenolidase
MIEKQIEIATSDGVSEAIVYRPDEDGQCPGVIHLTDIGGIRPAHCDIARRLAGEGYVVLVPNVFYRIARPPVFPRGPDVTDEQRMKRLSELAAPLTPEAIERDSQAFIDALASEEHVSEKAGLGVAGYCFTGAVAMRIAATCPDRIAAAASFHGGGLFTDSATSPHLVLPRIKARLYFAHAVKDRSMPEEAIRNLERALEDWGGRYQSEAYEGAYHSWTSSDSPVYNQPQAERAFRKLVSLLAETLVGQEDWTRGGPGWTGYAGGSGRPVNSASVCGWSSAQSPYMPSTVPNGMCSKSSADRTMPAIRAQGRNCTSPIPMMIPGTERIRMIAVMPIPSTPRNGAAVLTSAFASGSDKPLKKPARPPKTANTMIAASTPKQPRMMWSTPRIFTCCAMAVYFRKLVSNRLSIRLYSSAQLAG